MQSYQERRYSLHRLGYAGGACHFHANPDKASELGQRGGKSSRQSLPSGSDATAVADRPVKTVEDVTELLAKTIQGVCSGSIDSRIANTVGYLAAGMLKALQQGASKGWLRVFFSSL